MANQFMNNPQPPTHEDVSTTLRTLALIDHLQGSFYAAEHEKAVRGKAPHCHTDAVELSEEALGTFIVTAPMGCAKGISMNTTAFVGAIKMANLEKEFAQTVEQATSSTSHE